MPKTWNEKLNVHRQPHVDALDKPFAGIPAGSKILILTPLAVKQFIDQIPYGQSSTVEAMRRDLAKQWQADATCPLSTGIFVRIVAEAALEEHGQGVPLNKITPFWRLIDEKSKVAKKLTCGTEWVQRLREEEQLN